MDKLTTTFEKILNIPSGSKGLGRTYIDKLLDAVKARDAFIIGKDEKLSVHDECDTYLDQGGWVCEDHHCWANYKDKDTRLTEPPYHDPERPQRNELKAQQRKRAKETL